MSGWTCAGQFAAASWPSLTRTAAIAARPSALKRLNGGLVLMSAWNTPIDWSTGPMMCAKSRPACLMVSGGPCGVGAAAEVAVVDTGDAADATDVNWGAGDAADDEQPTISTAGSVTPASLMVIISCPPSCRLPHKAHSAPLAGHALLVTAMPGRSQWPAASSITA